MLPGNVTRSSQLLTSNSQSKMGDQERPRNPPPQGTRKIQQALLECAIMYRVDRHCTFGAIKSLDIHRT